MRKGERAKQKRDQISRPLLQKHLDDAVDAAPLILAQVPVASDELALRPVQAEGLGLLNPPADGRVPLVVQQSAEVI